jgi:3-deoxy-D-manno-octulosonate 8-phosphate phosphatase (KDO 8-P phosphatase)
LTDATPIKCIILDVDGTLTDGSIMYQAYSGDIKRFDVTDGLGIRLAQGAGIRIAVISSRHSNAVDRRMKELQVTDLVQSAGNKRTAVRALLAKYEYDPVEVAFIGDDLNDLPAFGAVGLKIAVADAADIVKENADHVTTRPGGRGAVREAIEYILRREGRFDDAVAAYLNSLTGPEAGSAQ